QPADDFVETVAVDSIDGAVQFQRLLRGQIPPKRILLSHQQAELAFHFVTSLPRHKAEHACIARSWVEQAGEHLEHRRFAGAIRSEKSHELAFFNLKRNLIGRARVVVAPLDQSLNRTPESALLSVGPVNFG